MRNILMIVLLSITLFSCKEKVGNLEGTAYWKYNDYVGNKPDAGTVIKLYTIEDDSIFKYKTTVGLDGKFKIENIKVGRYLMIAVSKNTNKSPDELLSLINIYKDKLDSVFNCNLTNDFKTEFLAYDDRFEKLYLSDNEESIQTELSKNHMKLCETTINKLPNKIKSALSIYTAYSNSINIQIITVKENETTSEQIDFGVTYF